MMTPKLKKQIENSFLKHVIFHSQQALAVSNSNELS